MQALYVSNGELSYLGDYPRPEVQPGQALIRLKLAGICATDLEIVKGYASFSGVLGHEFVGVVEEADEPNWLGERVVGGINLGCGNCSVCQTDGPEHCPQRRVLGIIGHDGAFADYLVLPVKNLLPVPDEVSDELAVFTEPLAAALRIREQIRIQPSAQAAVVGPGRLGLLVGQVLALDGTEVTMFGRRPESLVLAQQLGFRSALIKEAADDSFDLVVEATGNEAGLASSLRIVRPLGTMVLKSTFSGQATADLTKLVVGEVTVVGSRCGPFAPALRLLAESRITVRPLIEARYPLAQGLAAFRHAARPGVHKVLLHP
jgi:threonine dehydrogenase-like Zn-dependent dehydrogenase